MKLADWLQFVIVGVTHKSLFPHHSLTDRQVTRNLAQPGESLKYTNVEGHLMPVSLTLSSNVRNGILVSPLPSADIQEAAVSWAERRA